MAAGLKVEGMRELRKTLTQVSPAEARRIARRTVTAIARGVRDDARKRAPVDTGDLKRAVKSRQTRGERDEAAAQVWADRSGGRTGRAYHWHLLEFGTEKMPAQPFLNPTIEEWRSNMPGIYRRQWYTEYAREMEKRARKQRARQGSGRG